MNRSAYVISVAVTLFALLNQSWLLKKSPFLKTAQIWRTENVQKEEKVVCRAS